MILFFFFFSSRRRHTRFKCDWSSDVCSSDLGAKLKFRSRRKQWGLRQKRAWLNSHKFPTKRCGDRASAWAPTHSSAEPKSKASHRVSRSGGQAGPIQACHSKAAPGNRIWTDRDRHTKL